MTSKLKSDAQDSSPDHSGSLRDRLLESTVKVFEAYGFQLRHVGKNSLGQMRVIGDSGVSYVPDIVAQRGRLSMVCEIRTRGQRGRGKNIDRGAVQLLQA